VVFGLVPVFSLSLEDAGGALSDLTLAQGFCTTHPSSRVFYVLSQRMSRLADWSLSV